MSADSAITPIAVAVVEWNGQFLVGPRPAGKPLAGYWEFPGGRAEPGETLSEAAVRECREETGLEVAITGSYGEVRQAYDHGSVRIHFFACRPLAPQPEPRAPFLWMEREGLARVTFPPANAALLAMLCARS
jgi:8-oxo-dGTP diphosphatase